MNLNKSLSSLKYPEQNVYKTYQIKTCSKSAIKKPKKRDNTISAYKLLPRNRSIFNDNRQNNCCNDHTLVQSRERSQNDMAKPLYVFKAKVL